jgi:hypothetical protein
MPPHNCTGVAEAGKAAKRQDAFPPEFLNLVFFSPCVGDELALLSRRL